MPLIGVGMPVAGGGMPLMSGGKLSFSSFQISYRLRSVRLVSTQGVHHEGLVGSYRSTHVSFSLLRNNGYDGSRLRDRGPVGVEHDYVHQRLGRTDQRKSRRNEDRALLRLPKRPTQSGTLGNGEAHP